MNGENRETRVLIIDDDAEIRYSIHRVLSKGGYSVSLAGSGEEGLKKAENENPDVIFLDNRMEGMSGIETLRRLLDLNPNFVILIMTAYGTPQTPIEAMKFGAHDYLLKPFDSEKLLGLTERAYRARCNLAKSAAEKYALFDSDDYKDSMVGNSDAMQTVYKTIGQVAASDVTVLISGESGTGKELVAKCICNHSLRGEKAYLAVNCAALPDNLIESELFGHERGSFTGATAQKIGKFELCDGGTIFLDEVGDMSPLTQTKLLRVLQEGEIQRVGGNETIKVDVRLIAATNRDLEEMVAQSEFREDLYYRLNVVRIRLPALRARTDDIPDLIDFILRRVSDKAQTRVRAFSEEALSMMMNYDWPGNVRELENVVQHCTVIAQGEIILPDDLPDQILPDGAMINTETGGQVSESGRPSDGEQHGVLSAVPESDEASSSPSEMVESDQEPSPSMLGGGDEEIAPDTGPDAAFDRVFAELRRQSGQSILRTLEIEMIRRALKETGGNQVRASALLGITRATLRKRIEQYSIRY